MLVDGPGLQSLFGADSEEWFFALTDLQVESEGMCDGRLAEEVAVKIVFFVLQTLVVADLHPTPIHGGLDGVILALLDLGLEVGEGIHLSPFHNSFLFYLGTDRL